MNLTYNIYKRNFFEVNIASNARVLDVGCGAGDTVHYMRSIGYEAYGIDIEFKVGEYSTQLQQLGQIRLIQIGGKNRSTLLSGDKYIWPNFEERFDVIISRAVIEHVRNLKEVVESSRSMLKPGGKCLHYYLSKYSIIEPHIGVPFGGFLTSEAYITAMCTLGICFRRNRGRGKEAFAYMKNFTAYRDQTEIDTIFKNGGFRRIKSLGPLQCNYGLVWRIIGRIPFVNYMFSIFRSRVTMYEVI